LVEARGEAVVIVVQCFLTRPGNKVSVPRWDAYMSVDAQYHDSYQTRSSLAKYHDRLSNCHLEENQPKIGRENIENNQNIQFKSLSMPRITVSVERERGNHDEDVVKSSPLDTVALRSPEALSVCSPSNTVFRNIRAPPFLQYQGHGPVQIWMTGHIGGTIGQKLRLSRKRNCITGAEDFAMTICM
jgi:hypothetical protein